MTLTSSRIRGLALATLIVGCTSASDKHDDRPRHPAAADSSRAWSVSVRGLGPLHAGMTQAEAESAIGSSLAISTDSGWKNCAYTSAASLPAGVHIMVENGVVARIDIDSAATVATTEGAKVGDSEDHVRQMYEGRVAVTPQKYTAGHYLTVHSLAPADSQFRIVFETDGQRVLRYRAGQRPAVEYVERCG